MPTDWKSWINTKIDEFDGALSGAVPGYETAKKVTMNTVTLGGHAALDLSKQRYDSEREKYETGALSFHKAQAELKIANESLGRNVSNGIRSIEEAMELVRRLSYGRVSGPGTGYRPNRRLADLKSTNAFVHEFNAAQQVGFGAGAGVAASAGAWFLVSHLGIASTGTAIGTLSGAAAFNATLAWFGGGAIAAGGGGMALGGFMLSGIAALPVFLFVAYKSYSGAKEIDKATEELEANCTANEKAEADMKALLPRITHASEEVRAITTAFVFHHEESKSKAFSLAAELSERIAAFTRELSSIERLDK